MRHILVVANQKGGVGKTTTAINLSAGLSKSGRKLLLIDMDAQGNATMGSGVEKNQIEWTIGSALFGQVAFEKIVQSTEFEYDVLPANGDLSAVDAEWLQRPRRYTVLREWLAHNALDYDNIIIDCPPGLNLYTVNSLFAADGLLIPMQCEYFSLEGLSDLLRILSQLRDKVGARIKVWGILRTMYDGRNKLTHTVSEQLYRHFSSKVFKTVIPRNVSLAEAPSFGQPIQIYDPNSKGAQAFQSLTEEAIERLQLQS